MIKKANTLQDFSANSERTEMLITAMEKIKAYNWLYQNKTFEQNLELGYTVQKVQDAELVKIQNSCSAHAIISLSTNFEVFYKDLLQELLNKYSDFFKHKKTKYTSIIDEMCNSNIRYDYETISEKLVLKNRFDYYEFFDIHTIPFLDNNEKKIIEHIFVVRNNYVHNAGKIDRHTKSKLKKYPSPTNEGYLTTETKRLRTKYNRLICKVYDRIHKHFLKP